MSWLKKIGQIIVAGFKLELGLAPVIQAQYPQTANILQNVNDVWSQFVGIITTVEAVGSSLGLPGADKVRAAGPLVGQLIQQSAFMANKTIADTAKFSAACQTIAGGIADLLNSLKEPPADAA